METQAQVDGGAIACSGETPGRDGCGLCAGAREIDAVTGDARHAPDGAWDAAAARPDAKGDLAQRPDG